MSSHNKKHNDEDIDLRHTWGVISRNKWPILSFGAAMSALAAWVVINMSPVYTASATVLIESEQANVISIEEVYSIDAQTQQFFETQFEIMNSRPLVERVIVDLDLATKPEFDPDVLGKDTLTRLACWAPFELPNQSELCRLDPIELVITEYYDRLSVDPIDKTQLVNLHFESADPDLAADVANAHANAYIQSILDARLAATESAAQWMADQLDELQGQLLQAEQKLQQFREDEQVIDVEGLKSLPAREVNELTSRLVAVRRELSQARISFRQIFGYGGEPVSDLSSIPAIIEDPIVQDMQRVVALADGKVAELSKRYGPMHPKMIEAQSERSVAEANLRLQQGNVAEAIRKKYQAAIAEEADLLAALNRAKQDYQEVGRKESALAALQREGDTNRNLYELFYSRISETAATDNLAAVPARVIAPAVPPILPSKPKKGLTVVLVFLASLAIAVLAAFLLEAINNTIRGPIDVEEHLNVPMLGVVPLLKGRKLRHTSVGNMFLSNAEPSFNESVGRIRTNIALDNMQHPHKIIVVTSAISGEGKSTLAINLAHAFGQVDQRVLLVDADMRRPSVSRELNIATHRAGMSELLSGNTTLSRALCRSEKYNIDVLPTGLLPKNPLELLSSRHLTNALMVLRDKYDRIIIDTPPLLSVSDGLVVAKQADSIIFVVKPETATIRQINLALDNLVRVNARVSGIVLSQMDRQKADLYGTYSYENSDRSAQQVHPQSENVYELSRS